MGITIRVRLGLGALLLAASAAALADNAMTTEAADLYAGPDSSYPVVAQLDPNTPIQVMGCLDDWSWCDVAVEDGRGWMYSPDITYAYQDGYVPLYTYAPALGIAVVPFVIDDYWGRYYHSRSWYPRREEWAHRVVEHRRPPGPPPSAALPPRPEHREAGRADDRGIRLGRADAQSRDADHRDAERRDAERRDAERRDAERRDAERRDAERREGPGDNRSFGRPPPARQAEPHAMPPAAPNPPRQAPEAPRGVPHEDHARPNPVTPAPRAMEPEPRRMTVHTRKSAARRRSAKTLRADNRCARCLVAPGACAIWS